MPEVHVGIGSNIEPVHNLREAVYTLQARFPDLRTSSVYRSPAYGFVGDDFLNMVAAFATDMTAADVDAFLSSLEYAGGRVRAPSRYSDRTLDLDLLLYGQCVHAAQRLPREDVTRYSFVLAPLAEISPDTVHPVTGETAADAWARLEATGPQLSRLGAIGDLG